MELTSASSKSCWYRRRRPPHHHVHHRILSLSNHTNHHCHKAYKSLTITTCSNPKPSIQIQLPLNRPQRKEIRPIKPPKPTITTTPTTSSAATSDVLRLLDNLGLPIVMELYVSLIKECIVSRDPTGAMDLCNHISRSRIRLHLSLLNRLLVMLVSCGCMDSARKLFDKMPAKNTDSWAAMIAGYMYNDAYEETIDLFFRMRGCGYHYNDAILEYPLSWIVVCILKACANTMNFDLGIQIHAWLSKVGYSRNLFFGSSLVSFYGKVGNLEAADVAFNETHYRNSVIWTAKIVNDCNEERFDEVISGFKNMGRTGTKKNCYTISSVLKACTRTRNNGQCGQQVHANAIKLGLEMDNYVQCGLVDLYGKCGLVNDARKIFEMNGDERNYACWNSMLACFVQHGYCLEALKLLYKMKAAGLQPRETLLNDVMLACGS